MKMILVMLKKTLFWSYERGTWQYDVLCVLILAFIFFMPNDLFRSKSTRSEQAAAIAEPVRVDDQQPKPEPPVRSDARETGVSNPAK
ncbi:MAG: hypothetical protein DMF61_16395 [Blastocatellia bacterium AA13]|nr:MAG: hypothetical protein DMF61_16395 [Blastocatellia bacterium AA13]